MNRLVILEDEFNILHHSVIQYDHMCCWNKNRMYGTDALRTQNALHTHLYKAAQLIVHITKALNEERVCHGTTAVRLVPIPQTHFVTSEQW